VVAPLNGDVSYGLIRSQVVEMDNPPLLTTEKTQIACEKFNVHVKHMVDTNRKPTPENRRMTSFPVGDAANRVPKVNSGL
jgi:hypothetical protein